MAATTKKQKHAWGQKVGNRICCGVVYTEQEETKPGLFTVKITDRLGLCVAKIEIWRSGTHQIAFSLPNIALPEELPAGWFTSDGVTVEAQTTVEYAASIIAGWYDALMAAPKRKQEDDDDGKKALD